MTSRLDGMNDGARPSAKAATEPERAEIARHEEKGGIPSLSGNPRGVRARGSLVCVREDDLATLVLAAREVAFEPFNSARIQALDKASEVFADAFPWHDPNEDCRALKMGETVQLPGSTTQAFTALVSDSRDVVVQAAGPLGGQAMILPASTIRALALVERRIP